MRNLAENVRRHQIVTEGLVLVRRKGFEAVTCASVAERCKCSYRTVQRLYKNRDVLSRAILALAIETGEIEVAEAGKRIYG